MAARPKPRARRKTATRRKPRSTARKKTKSKASRTRTTKKAARQTTARKKSAPKKKRAAISRKAAAVKVAVPAAAPPKLPPQSLHRPPLPGSTHATSHAVATGKPLPAAGVAHPSAPSAGVAATVPELVGRITHYFAHVNAGVIALERGELRIGDTVHIRGHTTDFYQRLEHMEVDHRPIEVARAGQSVGIQVPQRVREHDQVFKVSK